MQINIYKTFSFLLCLCLLTLSELYSEGWNQCHGNGPNNGFIPVRTAPASEPAWSEEVGPIDGTSPVIGPDGTIYVGNAKGELIAINSDGTPKWKHVLARGWRLSTPAIDEKGNVYVTATFKGVVRDHRHEESEYYVLKSNLYCYDSEGNCKWMYTPGKVTLPEGYHGEFFFTSTPKVAQFDGTTHLFLVQAYWNTFTLMQENFLAVIHEEGFLEDARYLSEATFAHLSGGGGLFRKSAEIGPKPLPYNAVFEQNAVSIVNYPAFRETPLIIAADDTNTITAFTWLGRNLSPVLWKKAGNNTTFRFNLTAPAVFENGILMLGRSDGNLLLLDPETGNELFQPWPKFDSGIYSTPASFLRQMYFTTRDGEVVALDTNGEVWHRNHLDAQSASSPAMSANFLYLNAADGLHTLSFDLEKKAHFQFQGGGTCSPAIGDNGMVYTLGDHTLFAFPRN